MAECTRRSIQAKDYVTTRKPMDFGVHLFRNGDGMVSMLIANVFVCGFAAYVITGTAANKDVRALIPAELYQIYLGQVMQPGC